MLGCSASFALSDRLAERVVFDCYDGSRCNPNELSRQFSRLVRRKNVFVGSLRTYFASWRTGPSWRRCSMEGRNAPNHDDGAIGFVSRDELENRVASSLQWTRLGEEQRREREFHGAPRVHCCHPAGLHATASAVMAWPLGAALQSEVDFGCRALRIAALLLHGERSGFARTTVAR
jgi:hypothetical protein